MNFQAGDKVKFLNAKGGGIIRKIIDTRMVSVAIDGGFDIPVLSSELIRVEGNEPGARFFTESFDKGIKETGEVSDPVEDERSRELPLSVRITRKSEEILLAFVPHEQKWLITGLLDVFLINNGSWDVLYNLIIQKEDGSFEGKDYGSCFPDSRLLLETISREQLPEWTAGILQFLFHKSHSPEILPPFNSEFRVAGAKFYNEASYRETGFLAEKAIVVKVLSFKDYHRVKSKIEPRPIKSPPSKEDEALILKYQTAHREAEVDLHIHELIEDPDTLEKQEILEYQMAHFERCLDSAIASHFLKVTFIHGVGNGVLRQVLLDLLGKHGGIQVFDAPMQKYGVGAVEIRIPHNL